MAGIGPAPKDPSQRRNRSAPQRGEWVDLPPLVEPVLPELPPLAEGEGWSARAQATWAAWRADPVTAQYTPADVSYALDAIMLYEAMTPSNANEVRLRMDGLGLTPKGKRDLRWRVGDAAPPASESKATKPSNTARRARLSVVQ